jgi:hypothetical protein
VIVHNKLECFTLAGFLSLLKCFWVRAGAYPRVKHKNCASLGWALVLPPNIILGWRGLPGTNTQAYYKNPSITAVKSYIILPPGVDLIKLFCCKFTQFL